MRPSLNSALNFLLKSIVPTKNCRKSYDWDTVNALDEAELIIQGNHRNKSVYLTDEGLVRARQLLEQFGIADWTQD